MSGGRPTKYRDEYPAIAKAMCRMGATLPDLANEFEVNVCTIKLWMATHEAFSAAVKIGKEPADNKVEMSLYSRAVGYSITETVVKVVNNELVKEEIIKNYPPDPASMIFWLRNRKPKDWRAKQEESVESDKVFDGIVNVVRAVKE